MSQGYQGRNWKKPQDRGEAPRGRRAAPERGGGGADGKDRESEPSLPYLKDISAMNMERYIEAVHQFTLSSREHARLAPWIRGRIPLVGFLWSCLSTIAWARATQNQGTSIRPCSQTPYPQRRNGVNSKPHSGRSQNQVDTQDHGWR